jgi:hypothetical protein
VQATRFGRLAIHVGSPRTRFGGVAIHVGRLAIGFVTTHTQADPSPHVDQGGDKTNDGTRIARAASVTTAATKLPRYTSDATFKGAVDGLGNAGNALKTAVSAVTTADAAAHLARTGRDTQRSVYNKAYGVAVKLVEQDAVSKADIEDAGFVFLDPSHPGLILPSGIAVKYDGKHSLIRVHVLYAAGRRPCVVEISVDPVTATSWQRLSGNGVMRALSGYAPGTYWIHAATVRAQNQSAWFGPVSVLVK